MHIQVKPSGSALGAEIVGADDLVMWDDCSTQHKATFDYPASLPRLMHRTTVIGGAAWSKT